MIKIKEKISKIKEKYFYFLNKNNNLYNKNYILNKEINFIKKNVDILEYYINNSININNIKDKIFFIEKYINNIEIYFLLDPNFINIDECYIYINSNIGGKDSNDWSDILFNVYKKYIIKKNMKYEIIYKNINNFNKIKNIILKIKGNFSYSILKNETGIHKLIRKSPFDSYKKHTSFSKVFVYNDIINDSIVKNKYINESIDNKDLKIIFSKSSGPGGQHVNTTNSSVKVLHIPTNISTNCQNSRSQHINKNIALKNILYKVNNNKLKNISEKNKKLNKIKYNLSLSNNIRIYYLDKSTIKDNISNKKYNNIDFFLNGDLDILIKNNLESINNKNE
ncbi:peptide chain release factor-like protein [Candidatus Nardonella dryophthoridicola]|uniref:Peptide chain release factor 2 n=1 Tax=endosymbiont of Rhynchophorus ferrugineus TaxID=1972133 RepID=A0A2Z5T3J8_9GAMM|nr:peptide chain release factor-like protein [Candidatus Nardonella dryophthoridicola]BBA84968.1 peptide chain release factor 2 [endosymbiont of Rhynchophorus ferrugineus]